MRSVFFGGIGRYYFDGNGMLMDDTDVPFVSTISLVKRDNAGAMSEYDIGAMFALLGAGAEFIPWSAAPQTSTGILLQDEFVGDIVVLGHIVGGIESTAANIFFVNTGEQSVASAKVFRVLLVDPVSAMNAPSAAPTMRLVVESSTLHIFPGERLQQGTRLRLLDSLGRSILARNVTTADEGAMLDVDLRGLAPGSYIVELRTGMSALTARFTF